MATLTKRRQDYHTFVTSEISNGDVIDCEASLGRPADQVTIESIGGQTTLRFNVLQKVYRSQETYNSWMPNAGFYTQPTEALATVEVTKDDIIVETGSTQLWNGEFPIKDIKIVTKAANLKVTIS